MSAAISSTHISYPKRQMDNAPPYYFIHILATYISYALRPGATFVAINRK